MRIDIIGAGAWGTALAIHTAQQPTNQAFLWTQLQAEAQLMAKNACNQRYLADFALPASLHLNSLDTANAWVDICQNSDLIVIATPMNALRGVTQRLLTNRRHKAINLIWLSKGFEKPLSQDKLGLMAHEVVQQLAPELTTIGILSGPSFAQEVAAGKPCALVAASANQNIQRLIVQAFHFNNLRLYHSDDIIGAEVGGAVKNVLAIAAGLCDGLALGYNSRAALITRGLAEITRLGMALGAQFNTFMGLSGLGDLVLTTTGKLSRNRQVGLLLAQGNSLTQTIESLGHVAEGVYSAQTVVARAQALKIEMPICELIVKLLADQLTPQQAVQQLMLRQPKAELFLNY